ncbi:hypothetical protein POM88_026562 [Heracleum sosnowskyi]|uniref:Uncharacterized protein n=1 Tax=Heracleum sosnowskyi TaxID=360622 RepID=A0AAD8MQ41_9APIA|nr:hypothetical protein POM88_026562 [Heracleum sosnowskyi]
MILDVMVKVFSTKSTGWNGIPSYIKKLTHSLVHRYKVNVGALLMAHLKAAIKADVGGSSVSQEGDTAPSAANKEGIQTEPTVVPPEPKKKRARRIKTTVSYPAVSQKTVEETREINSSLDVPSQQGTSIEIGPSPKAPCIESAQTHGSQPEIPPLEETHSELGHSEYFSTPIDGSHISSVNQPPLSATLSPSSFPTHSFVSSQQPREGDSPNPSGFDHPSPIMDEPPSSGP